MDLSWRRVGTVLAGLALAGAVLALVAADLLPLWWWSELWQHPRPQLAVAALAGAVVWSLLVRLRWRWASLLVPLWALAGMIPALGGGAARGEGSTIATVVVANVHSANPDPSAAIATLLAIDAEVVVLLEPDYSWASHLQALRAAYPVRREILRDDNFGICVYARRGRITVWQPEGVDVPGLVCAIDGIEMLAVHPLPPFSDEYHAGWRAELDEIAAWAAVRPMAVVAGDLNTTPWSSAYRRLCLAGGLRGPGGVAAWTPTWMCGTPLAAPIDHVLVGSSLALSRHAVGPDIASDHRPVRVSILRALP